MERTVLPSLVLLAIAFSILAFTPARVRLTALICLAWRASIAVAASLSNGELVGSNNDALAFIQLIENRADGTSEIDLGSSLSSNGKELFLNGNAIVLRLIGSPDSSLAAHFMSVIGAALCLLLICKCWMLIAPNDYRGLRHVLLIYAFIPSVAANQSYVLREVWQSLALLMVFFAALSWSRRGLRPSVALMLFGGAALGATLHQAWLIAMLAVAGVAIVVGQGVTVSGLLERPTRAVVVVIVAAVLALLLSPVASQNERFQSLVAGDLLEQTNSFVDGAERHGLGSRAFYGQVSDPQRPWTLVPGFLLYQFAPLPNQIGGAVDAVLTLENLFRAWLVWAWWSSRKLFERAERRLLTTGMMMWLTVELVWSVGTVNWGTASRHHTTAYALLLIVGWASWRRRRLGGDRKAVERTRRTPVRP